MPALRITTDCFRCGKEVDKNTARTITALNNEQRYECFECFKQDRKNRHVLGNEIPEGKKYLYCEKCKFQFMARKTMCPYCNRSEFIVEGHVKLKDLL